jgi:hypothetical protein
MTTYGAQRIKQASRYSNRHDPPQLPHEWQLLETLEEWNDYLEP